MIELEDVQDETRDESLTEEKLKRIVNRTKKFLMGYCNNKKMFDDDDSLLEEVVFYLVCSKLNEDAVGRQGLENESIGGVSFTFERDLPKMYKNTLRRYTRGNFR